MVYKMKLNLDHFLEIKSGSKTIECRLFDSKRRKINIGDIIIFELKDNRKNKIRSKVEAIIRYPTFSDMFNEQDVNKFGFDNPKDALVQLRRYYSKEEEKKFTVTGIKIKVIKQ